MRKPFIAVHQKDVEECDTLDQALHAIDASREYYHGAGYARYDFEGGVYQLVDGSTNPGVSLSNHGEFDARFDRELTPFAVVDTRPPEHIAETIIQMAAENLERIGHTGVPDLWYHGFDNFEEARADLLRRQAYDAGLYVIVVFHNVLGPDRRWCRS